MILGRKIGGALAIFALVLPTACGEPEYDPIAGPEDGAWTAFRANAARTGHNRAAQTGRRVSEVWRVADINTTDYGAAKGSPSVEGDRVYVGSDDGRFTVFDRGDGSEIWSTVLPNTTQGIHGSPSIGADHVYIGGYNGTLYAFDKGDGTQIWSYNNGYQIGASPILVPAHGRVYNTHEFSNTGGGRIVSVDARTGDEIWEFSIRAHPHSSVAIDEGKELLFVGDNLAILHALQTRDGEKVWDVQLEQTDESESDIKTTPTVVSEHDLVVVGAWSAKVHAFEEETGALRWETDLGARVMSSTAYSPVRDAIYVGSLGPGNALHALDVTSGEELWRFEVGSSVMSSPAVSGDGSLIVVGAGNGNLYAVDATDGTEVWRHEIGGRVTASPALVGSMIFVSAAKSDLVALDTEPQ